MPPKEQLSDEINEALDTGDLDFSQMRKEDLEQFHMLVDDGLLLEPIAKHVVKEQGKDQLDELVDDYKPGQLVMKLLQ